MAQRDRHPVADVVRGFQQGAQQAWRDWLALLRLVSLVLKQGLAMLRSEML